MDRRYFVSRASLSMGGALLAPTIAFAASASEPIVETTNGKVRGYVNNGVYTFKGIPYGADTSGANRFMPAKKPQAWASVRDALKWGDSCPQGNGTPSTAAAAVAVPGPQGVGADAAKETGLIFSGGDTDVPFSENCLMINVFTRGLGDSRKRPVMVWIHGGGFNIGLGSGARTDGTNLARNHDVVSVSLNHRIGVFGYSHLGDLDHTFAQSGNIGQLDLVAALEWVRDNIAHFGGDPNNVTIHGESGGGAKIHILMAMPAAKGLFHRAICQSGIVRTFSLGGGPAGQPGRSRATEYAAGLLSDFNLTPSQVRDLQKVPVNGLLAAARVTGRNFSPVVGTADFPETPNAAIAKGSARVPYIVGCSMHEAASSVGTVVKGCTEEELQKRIAASAGKNAPDMIAAYRKNHPGWTPGELLIRIMSDNTRFGSIKAAEAHIQGGGGPTYMYLFDWESPVLPIMKAAHGSDCSFYFEDTEALGMAKGNPDAKQLAAKMSGAWSSFAKSGKPSAAGLTKWPEYNTDKRATMLWVSKPKIENDPMGADREVWEKITAA